MAVFLILLAVTFVEATKRRALVATRSDPLRMRAPLQPPPKRSSSPVPAAPLLALGVLGALALSLDRASERVEAKRRAPPPLPSIAPPLPPAPVPLEHFDEPEPLPSPYSPLLLPPVPQDHAA